MSKDVYKREEAFQSYSNELVSLIKEKRDIIIPHSWIEPIGLEHFCQLNGLGKEQEAIWRKYKHTLVKIMDSITRKKYDEVLQKDFLDYITRLEFPEKERLKIKKKKDVSKQMNRTTKKTDDICKYGFVVFTLICVIASAYCVWFIILHMPEGIEWAFLVLPFLSVFPPFLFWKLKERQIKNARMKESE